MKRSNAVRVREFFGFFHGNVRVLVVCRALWSVSGSIAAPYLSLYILALGASPVEVGLINSLAILGGMAMEPLGGYLADRRGRVKLIGISTYFYSFCWIFYIVAWDWRALAIGMALQQMALFYTPALNAILADSLPPGTRGRGFALERTFPVALGVIAPYFGGLLIEYFGGEAESVITAVRLCYSVSLLVGLLVATLRFRFLKETLSGDGSALSIRNFPSLLKESYGSVLDTIKWMPSSFRFIVLLQIIQSISIAMAAPFWILYATDVRGFTALNWGTLMLLSGIFGLVFVIPSGYLVDRYSARFAIILSILLAPISVILFLYLPSFWGAAAALSILSISNAFVTPSFAAIIADIIPRDRRGRIYALIGEQGLQVATSRMMGGGLLLLVPASIGSFIGGYLYTIDPGFPFIILIISLLLCLLITYRFVREPEKAEM